MHQLLALLPHAIATAALPTPAKSATCRASTVFVNETGSGCQPPRNPRLLLGPYRTIQVPFTTPKTSVVPSPLKSPKRRSLTGMLEATITCTNGVLPPYDIHHVPPSAQKMSGRPSPSKSPTCMAVVALGSKTT